MRGADQVVPMAMVYITAAYLAGLPASAQVALLHLMARQIDAAGEAFAMDWDNLALAQDLCPPAHAHKLRRMTEFCLQFDSPVVPDPYYGGSQGFEEVLDLVEDACEGLLRHVQRQLQAQVPPVQH